MPGLPPGERQSRFFCSKLLDSNMVSRKRSGSCGGGTVTQDVCPVTLAGNAGCMGIAENPALLR
jgi:hypothetical protein